MNQIRHRIVQAVTTRVTRQDWRITAACLAGSSCVALPLGWWSGLLHWHLLPASETLWVVLPLTLVVLPALREELVFRVLLPHPCALRARHERYFFIGFSVARYVLWHPFNALRFVPHARTLFVRPDCLTVAALFGVWCTIAYRRTRSLWPPVIVHWCAVTV